MAKASLYPTKITQPNQNESNGTKGKYPKEIGRDGKVHIEKLNERDLNDPKYYHLWKNTSNLKTGGMANCGNRSSYHCSHATYYGIKGYRNTCPIAGATGTYTQPAKLRMEFNPKEKGILSTAVIKSVKVSFLHRCVGVDVSNDKIYTSWGPNFCGFKHYPDRKVIRAKFAGQEETWNKNPKLSSEKFDEVTLVFKSTSKDKITYNDLANGHLDIQYGNNLNTNPGNIYIKNFKIEVEYEPGKTYIEGKSNSNKLYTSKDSVCASSIKFNIEAGYKNGKTKVSPSKAPKKFQNNEVTYQAPSNVSVTRLDSNGDGKTISFEIKDISGIAENKQVDFTVKDVGKISCKFESIKRIKPTITIPSSIEKNTAPKGIVSIKAVNGCAPYIIAYDENLDNPIHTFKDLNINNSDNIISQNDINDFYSKLSKLSCGLHKIIFKRGDETINEMPVSYIDIKPTKYNIKFYKETGENKVEVSEKITFQQNKYKNEKLIVEFVKDKDFLDDPVFSIINPTYGKKVEEDYTPARVNDSEIPFTPDKNGGHIEVEVGTYQAGDFILSVEEPENCLNIQHNIVISIESNHKQNFDELFVRGEDSTAFDYDYLVALEGDSVKEPIKVNALSLGASYKDIKVCTTPNSYSNINTSSSIPVSIINTTSKEIENVFLELNTLVNNEDGDLVVSTSEWLDEDGLFYNFVEKFSEYNKDTSNIISIKNLTPDDDEIDEEDVFIHIKKLYPNQKLDIEIPIFSFVEKEVYLQMLLFEEPIALYSSEDCEDKTQRFDLIEIRVYDATLVNMKIEGNLDILTPQVDCPLECFTTEGIKYTIKNIDSSSTDMTDVIIKNDPRLTPYKIINKEGMELDLDKITRKVQPSEEEIPYYSKLEYNFGNVPKTINIIGERVKNTVKFPSTHVVPTFLTAKEKAEFKKQINPDPIILKGYTDSYGYVTFYITIPMTEKKSYSVKTIAPLCKIEIETPNSNYKVIEDLTVYNPGETIPFKIKVTNQQNIFVNQFRFYPDVYNAGTSDEITIFYKACNLKDNQGILKTSFETAPNNYKLIKNKVEEEILCGVPPELKVSSKLDKIIVQQTQINRLSFIVKNKNRFNKDVRIEITEKEDSLKYSYYDHNVEAGDLIFSENKIIWDIGFMEKDSTINGYIDFKGDNLGLSNIEVIDKHFASEIEFNKKNCNCPEN